MDSWCDLHFNFGSIQLGFTAHPVDPPSLSQTHTHTRLRIACFHYCRSGGVHCVSGLVSEGKPGRETVSFCPGPSRDGMNVSRWILAPFKVGV